MTRWSAGPKVKVKCCGDIIQSKYCHDFVWCKCGQSFVDGGSSYLRTGGAGIEIVEEKEENDENG